MNSPARGCWAGRTVGSTHTARVKEPAGDRLDHECQPAEQSMRTVVLALDVARAGGRQFRLSLQSSAPRP